MIETDWEVSSNEPPAINITTNRIPLRKDLELLLSFLLFLAIPSSMFDDGILRLRLRLRLRVASVSEVGAVMYIKSKGDCCVELWTTRHRSSVIGHRSSPLHLLPNEIEKDTIDARAQLIRLYDSQTIRCKLAYIS